MISPKIAGLNEFTNQITKDANRTANSFIPIPVNTNKATDSRTPIFPKNIDGINIVSR